MLQHRLFLFLNCFSLSFMATAWFRFRKRMENLWGWGSISLTSSSLRFFSSPSSDCYDSILSRNERRRKRYTDWGVQSGQYLFPSLTRPLSWLRFFFFSRIQCKCLILQGSVAKLQRTRKRSFKWWGMSFTQLLICFHLLVLFFSLLKKMQLWVYHAVQEKLRLRLFLSSWIYQIIWNTHYNAFLFLPNQTRKIFHQLVFRSRVRWDRIAI